MDDLALAAFVFAISKYAFDFLAWICVESTDSLYREKLDYLWDKLHEAPIVDIAATLIQRLISRLALAKTTWKEL